VKRLVLVALAVLIGLAWAQKQQQAVREELVKTDQVIADVRPLVERSGNEEARRDLEWATSLQQAAWSAFHSSAYTRAAGLTLRARERARQARVVAGIDPDRVREEVQRNRELMAEWGPPVVKARDPRANELWKMALTEQRAAEGYLGRFRYGYALKFATAAREHGKAAVAAIRGRVGSERVKRELDRTDALIEKAQAKLGTGAARRATEVLNKAVELQRQARQTLADSRPLAALRLTLAARELLFRAWESVRARVTPDLVEQALAENDALITDWTEDIQALGDGPADLLEQGIRQQQAARWLFEQDKLQPALTECHAARELLRRAVEMVKTEDAPSEPR